MGLGSLALAFLAFIIAAYFFYGSFIARIVRANVGAPMPSHLFNDGQEFVPTNRFYLFCQHFSAIAASGPIAGPILACQKWGWLPCLLWISFGSVLIGAVHDFSALTVSVKHKGASIAHIAKEHIGPKAGLMTLIFIWVALIYVIVAFTQVTAATFVTASEELQNIPTNFHPGGAVAASAFFYLVLCLVMGVVQRLLNPKLLWLSLIFVPASLATIWMGTHFSTLFLFDKMSFELIILVYCAIASVMPVWLLLQPRGYLGGFILFIVLAVGILGLLFGGYTIQQPAVIDALSSPNTPPLLPFLFVTIACGACSGFHGLVCSGTTSKQVDKDRDIQSIGYGAMLAEGLVALIALSTIMILTKEQVGNLNPGTIYGMGIGQYLTLFVGEKYRLFAVTFGAMAFSTFVFDTLDVAARLARYLIQELFGWPEHSKRFVATVLTLALPAAIVLYSKEDSFIYFWTLFGSTNQLLAALTLLTITMWLFENKRPIAFTAIPMLFVASITLWSLGHFAYNNLVREPKTAINLLNGSIALLLIAITFYIASQAANKIAFLAKNRVKTQAY